MPEWLSAIVAIYSAITVPWLGWVSLAIIKALGQISAINERCHGREGWIRSVSTSHEDLKKKVDRIDRNIIKLGMKTGLSEGELEEGD